MTIPLMILAACAVFAGLAFGLTGRFEHGIEATLDFESLGHGTHAFDWTTAIVSTLAGFFGLGLSLVLYARPSPIPGRLATQFRPLYEASRDKFYVDELYDWVIVRTTRAFAVICEFLDVYLVDRLVLGIAHLPRLFGRDVLARYQDGLIQSYAAVSALGVGVLLLVLLLLYHTPGL